MKLNLQQTSCIPFLTPSSTQLWYEGRELSPWTQWTLWPVMTNGQAVGRGADMCLCFQPSLLRLISAPAATVGAPVPHSPQHPGLDQSTMWLRPGAKRARQTDGREAEGRDAKKGPTHNSHLETFLIQYAKCGGWSYSSKPFCCRISEASLKVQLITHEPRGGHGVKTMSNPLPSRFSPL